MGRKPKVKKQQEDILEIVEKEITYVCPTRGKVTEKVKVKVLKKKDQEASSQFVTPEGDILSKIEKSETEQELLSEDLEDVE